MAEDTPFARLLRRVRAGDQAAAEELLRSYEPEIRRIVRVRMSNSGLRRMVDSVDICQSVMANFYTRMALGEFEIESPAQLIKLLATMARNRLIHQARRMKAQKRGMNQLEALPIEEFPVADTVATPSRIVANRELLARVMEHFDADERRLAERRMEGWSWTGLASEFQESPDALRMRLCRAVDRVLQELSIDI
jgi:RNA polymerase sigma-70 factor (ECF subfamily)